MRSRASHLVLESLCTGPSAHYKRIVGRDHGDDIDALLFELVILFEVGWEVVHMASRLRHSESDTAIGQIGCAR